MERVDLIWLFVGPLGLETAGRNLLAFGLTVSDVQANRSARQNKNHLHHDSGRWIGPKGTFSRAGNKQNSADTYKCLLLSNDL